MAAYVSIQNLGENVPVGDTYVKHAFKDDNGQIQPANDDGIAETCRRAVAAAPVVSGRVVTLVRMPWVSPYLLRSNGSEITVTRLYLRDIAVRRLPPGFCRAMQTLTALVLQHMLLLDALPASMGDMVRLRELELVRTPMLARLPPSAARIMALERVHVLRCPPVRIIKQEVGVCVYRTDVARTVTRAGAMATATLTGSEFRTMCAAYASDVALVAYTVMAIARHRRRLPRDLARKVARLLMDSAGDPVWSE